MSLAGCWSSLVSLAGSWSLLVSPGLYLVMFMVCLCVLCVASFGVSRADPDALCFSVLSIMGCWPGRLSEAGVTLFTLPESCLIGDRAASHPQMVTHAHTQTHVNTHTYTPKHTHKYRHTHTDAHTHCHRRQHRDLYTTAAFCCFIQCCC